MNNIKVMVGPTNRVIIETWDRSYEMETILSIEEARDLANLIMDVAATAGANRALTSDDVV